MLCEILTDLGHEIVAEASRLERAVRIATEGDYDLAVLDLNLGNGVSFDVVDIVLGRRKPVVVSTGYGKAGVSAKYDACTVIQKPFTRDTISRAIERSLQRPRAQDASSRPGGR
jgi:DNA-binding NtrC family response regulator